MRAVHPIMARQSVAPVGVRVWVEEHTVASFFIRTFAISWALWLLPALGVGGIAGSLGLYVGVFGPAIAAATIVRVSGGSARAFLKDVGVRRAPRWYIGAIALSVFLVIAAMSLFVATGGELDTSLLGGRAAAFLPLLVVWSIAGTGEEYGWRGFALPRLQGSLTPVRATLLLGTLWGLWHLPLLAAADDPSHGLDALPLVGVSLLFLVAIIGYAFIYTYLYNRTRSVALAIVLHGSITAANAGFLLDMDDQVGGTYAHQQAIVTGLLVVVAILLVRATRGRLGLDEGRSSWNAGDDRIAAHTPAS